MYNTVTKALVALVMGLIAVAGVFFHKNIGISAETVTAIVSAVVTPFLVWLIPNLPKDS